MENSTSATSHSSSSGVNTTKNNKKKNNNNPIINANDDIGSSICFGSFSLSSKNATTSAAALVFPSSSSSDSSEKLQETQVMREGRKGSSPEFDDSRVTKEFILGGIEWPSPSSSSVHPHYQNIWEGQNLYNGEKTKNLPDVNGSSMTLLDYMHMNYVPDNSYGSLMHMNYVPDNSYGSLRAKTSFHSFHPNSSIYRSSNLFREISVLNYPSGLYDLGTYAMNGNGNFSPPMEIVNDQYLENMDNGYYNPPSNYPESSPYLPDQNVWDYGSPLESSLPGFNFFAMATSPVDSEQLRRVLERGNSWYTQETLKAVFPLIFQLMTDVHGHCIFEMLVDKCENSQLYAIVMKLQSESDLFLDATFCSFGSRSIQRLIKRLKKTGMEFSMTAILSRRSYDIMTDKIASHVIRKCFENLGDAANQVLYDNILSFFLPLATDPVGCLSVNECINNITGPRRAALLDLVADYASHLSYDPSGNFVVQHVLGLNNATITRRICYSLKGHYVELALLKGGSHVVEKCSTSSRLGLSLVVEAMLENDKILFLLSWAKFGNYAVQKALNLTKLCARDLYEGLIEALKPHYLNLLCKPRGKYVAGLIKDDVERPSGDAQLDR